MKKIMCVLQALCILIIFSCALHFKHRQEKGSRGFDLVSSPRDLQEISVHVFAGLRVGLRARF